MEENEKVQDLVLKTFRLHHPMEYCSLKFGSLGIIFIMFALPVHIFLSFIYLPLSQFAYLA